MCSYETHSLKRVCDDFIQEFLNCISSSHAVQDLIKKKLKMNIHSIIYFTWDDRLWGPQRRGRWLQKTSQNAPPHRHNDWHRTSAFTFFDIPVYPYKILIQHKLKSADSLKKAEFCRWLCRYTSGDVLVFDTFFFSDEAWFHLDYYKNVPNYGVRSSENSHIFQTVWLYFKKIEVWCAAMNRKCVGGPTFFWDNDYCRCIAWYYSAIYCTFV